jgi:nucleotide-binding universal stress UspA family protein
MAGGPNSRLAAQLAVAMATQSEIGPVKVTALHVVREGAGEPEFVRAQKVLTQAIAGVPYEFDFKIVDGDNVIEAILRASEGCDLIVIGATNEPLFKNLLIGNIPEQVARRARVTTIMVKRRQGPLRSLLRETVLMPTTGDRVVRNGNHRRTLTEKNYETHKR